MAVETGSAGSLAGPSQRLSDSCLYQSSGNHSFNEYSVRKPEVSLSERVAYFSRSSASSRPGFSMEISAQELDLSMGYQAHHQR